MMIGLIKPSEIEIEEEIGDGATAQVFKAKWNGKFVAVKKFDGSCPSRLSNDFKREVDLLSTIKHKNIVQLFGYCDQRNNTFLVSELMEGGTLYDYICKENKSNWELNLRFIKNIIDAMVYLHENKILHLDLKSLNILLNKEKNLAKITDFGLSKMVSLTSMTSIAQVKKSAAGTTRYMAPETAKGFKQTDKTDVWSFGCILVEIATRKQPFNDLQDQAIFLMLQTDKADIPLNLGSNCPVLIGALINKCLERNPNSRPTFVDITKEIDNINSKMLNDTLKTITQNIDTVKDTQSLKTIINDITKRGSLEDIMRRLNLMELKNNQQHEYNQQNEYYQQCRPNYESYDDVSRFDEPLINYFKDFIQSNQSKKISGAKSTGKLFVSSGRANGREIFEGPRGGQFILTKSGKRSHIPKEAPRIHSNVSTNANFTGRSHVSSGSANGNALFQGPRGGTFYYTASGNKRYV